MWPHQFVAPSSTTWPGKSHMFLSTAQFVTRQGFRRKSSQADFDDLGSWRMVDGNFTFWRTLQKSTASSQQKVPQQCSRSSKKALENFASASNSEDSAEMMILLKDDGCWWLLMDQDSDTNWEFFTCKNTIRELHFTTEFSGSDTFFFAQLQRFFKKIIEAHYRINIQQISDFHVISL